MDEKDFKKVMLFVLIIALLIMAFIIIKPIIISVLAGFILAYIFHPLYKKIHKVIFSPNLSALIIVAGSILIILIPIILLVPAVANQSINFYLSIQNIDISSFVQNVFPNLFNSLSESANFAAITSSFTSKLSNFLLNAVQGMIFNFPSFLLQMVIVLFTFFFMLRDYDITKEYLLSVSPFSKESHEKLYDKFEQITNSILYGQLIVGIAQGVISGIGYFIFNVPNALLLTVITVIVGILPVIGPWLVWMPIDIYLFTTGHTNSAIGLLIYGLLVINWIDTLIRPLIVSKMAKMNSALALIGMVGGLYVFGVLGLIIGPLILAYLLLVAEFYKQKKVESILIQEQKPKTLPPLPSISFPRIKR